MAKFSLGVTAKKLTQCRWCLPGYILFVIWFFHWVGFMGVSVVSIVMIIQIFFSDHPSMPPPIPTHEAVVVIFFYVFILLLWRLSLCVKSDIRQAVTDMGGSFFAEKRLVKGRVGTVAYEIQIEKPFFNIHVYPEGFSKRMVCGNEVRMLQVGGYFPPKYMRRLSEIRLRSDLEKPLSRRVRLCPGNSENEIIDDNLAITSQWRRAFEESFGTETGDWEIELEQNRLSALIRSGTWEGTTFAGKVRRGIELMHQMADDLASIGQPETN